MLCYAYPLISKINTSQARNRSTMTWERENTQEYWMSAILQSCLLQDLCHYISITLSLSLPVCLCSPKLISRSSGTSIESIADQSTSLCILQAARGSTVIVWLLIKSEKKCRATFQKHHYVCLNAEFNTEETLCCHFFLVQADLFPRDTQCGRMNANTNANAFSDVARMRLDENVCALSVWCKHGWNKCLVRCKQGMSWEYGSPETRRVKLKNSHADEWSQQLDRKTIQSAESRMLIASRLREIPRAHKSISNIGPRTQSDCFFLCCVFLYCF